jgi:cysteinyl-tRNA synthetase
MQESYPPGIYDKTILDRILHVEDEEAFEMCRRLAREEGLFVGMSSGAALAGALSVAKELDAGTVVTIFPDGGERYLSTSLFVPPERRGIKVFDLYKREEIGLRIEDKSGGPNLFTFGPSMDALDEFEPWRRIVLFDVLNRYLRGKGHDSALVVGLADFDDRTLHAARDAGLSRKEFCREAKDKIHNLAARLNIHTGTRFVSASKYTDIAIEICQKLLSKGTAYEKLRSVYFDVRRDKEYGALIHMDLSKIFPGKTVDLESYVKDNPRDFTLFKRASLQDLKEDNVLKTDWGNVRPSWYLQQASAAMAGCERVDVVLAGQMHAFPHVDNLRSIWKNALNMVPQAWMLSLSVDFKEQGQDSPAGINHFLNQGLKSLAIRMWLLSASYHKILVSGSDNSGSGASGGSVHMWLKNWARVQDVLVKLKFFAWKGKGIRPSVEQAVFDLKKSLQTALEHDLSIHKFWPRLFNLARVAHKLMDEKELTFDEAEFLEQNLKSMDDVLGILDWQNLPIRPDELPGEVKEILVKRTNARQEKNFDLADTLRDELVRQGYRVVDTAQGAMLFKEG